MDLSLERDGSVLGSLFNQIITDMKNTSPLWEDFIAKAGKLHACLRAAIQAIAAYLDAFQKIADAATNSRGATKEIGTALTRVCLRHKAVETRLKTFTNAIMDCLVLPLQDKLEDWKRSVVTIDKEHAKEHKRCRAELKKRSSDTLRLQKKARKGQSDTIQSLVDSHMQDVTLRRAELEEVEKKSLRSAMIEERMRYCTFVDMLQPVVKEECEVMSELGHLQEAMQSIALVTKEPAVLPQGSEELILDAKTAMSLYPESPGGGSGSQGGCSNSLGSRKSSVCSISSMNSSGSSGSPGHHHYQRSLSQFVSPAIRLKPGESSDSGFCSSPALTTQTSTAANPSHAVSTWPPHSQDVVAPPATDRPHTISTAYEKGHQRPPLTVYTFQNPETILEGGGTNATVVGSAGSASGQTTPSAQKPPGGTLSRPPLPVRCSSLERPLSANNNRGGVHALTQRQCPSPIPAHITKELSAYAQQHQQQLQQQQQQHQLQSSPTYVNMSELASMVAIKISNQQQHLQYQEQHGATLPHSTLQQQQSSDSHSSIASLVSNDSITHTTQNYSSSATITTNTNTPQGHGNHSYSSASSSATPSLHSHPSIDSTVATPIVGQTPTPSSGCSTPHNHYSPLLTNSPSSTAAGTPSGGSGGGGSGGFVYGINSPTPPPPTQVVTGSCTSPPNVLVSTAGDVAAAEDALKITDTNIAVSSATTHNIETSTQHEYKNASSAVNTDSPTIVENDDERSRASVLQKASMFEKQAAAAAAVVNKSTPPPCSGGGGGVRNNNTTDNTGGGGNLNSGLRRIDDYRAPTPSSHQYQHQTHQQTDHIATDNEVGATRIARRSSVNAAKPPPPVRRSSSVTPSQNISISGHQQQQQISASSTANSFDLNHQEESSMSNSIESLPPPPAYLLVDQRPSHSSPMPTHMTSLPPPPNVMPASALMAAETVKLLSAQRHQPGSPSGAGRIEIAKNYQQQHSPQNNLQSQQQQLTALQNQAHKNIRPDETVLPASNSTVPDASKSSLIISGIISSDACYSPCVDVHRPAVVTPSSTPCTPLLLVPSTHEDTPTNFEKEPIYHNQQNQQEQQHKSYHMLYAPTSSPPPSPLPQAGAGLGRHSTDSAPPPPLPPPNPKRHHHNYQQRQSHVQHQQHQQSYKSSCESNKIYGNQLSLRTSSPGIYAQPKISNNMSSFRTPSPSSNNFHQPHQMQAQLPPTQPKTNPNLIAQLSARLNKQQQQGSGGSGGGEQTVYISSTAPPSQQQQPNEPIYVRNNGIHRHHHHQQQQQQHNYDDYATSSNLEKNAVIGCSSIRSKTKAEFLENLNAKLAKQGISGRAFAVRNLINSKALPDPRLCHESLMDQIKRGATLKRNQKINDRSAPKIR